MAGTFPITEARQELAVTPTRAVRANIDTRTGAGAAGAAVGQALVAGAGFLGGIIEKRERMQDDNSNVEANNIRSNADVEFVQFKLDNTQDKWQGFRQEQTRSVFNEVGSLKFSPEALARQNIISQGYSNESNAQALVDATRQLKKETLIIQTDALVEAFAQDDPREKLDAINRYKDSEATKAFGSEIINRNIRAALKTGLIKKIQNQIALDPEASVEMLQAELDARRDGTTTNDELNKILPDEKDINALLKTARAEKTQRKTRDEKILNDSAAKVENVWLDRWATGVLTKSEVLAWNPPLTDPDAIREHADIQEEWIRKTSLTEGKGKGWLKVMQDVDLNPKQWTPSRIYAQAPKFVTGDQAATIVAHWRTLREGKNSNGAALHTRYQSIIKSQLDLDIFGRAKGDKAKKSANEISLRATEFFRDTPDATNDQWRTFYDEVTQDRKKGNSLIGKLFRLTPLGASLRILGLRSRLKELKPVPGENVPTQGTFNEGDTLPDPETGEIFVLIKKGNTPAEDVWVPQETR